MSDVQGSSTAGPAAECPVRMSETGITDPVACLSVLRAVVAASDDAIVTRTLDGVVTSWNSGAERMFGYRSDEMIGQSILRIFPPDRIEEESLFSAAIRDGRSVQQMPTLRLTRSGAPVHVSVTLNPIHNRDGEIIGISSLARNISERVEAERHLEREKYYDTLTQLPNGRRFRDTLDRVLGRSDDATIQTGMLLVCLDRFKDINDTLGRASGDVLLAQAGDRLRGALAETSLVARVASAEFAILLPGIGAGAELDSVAERIRCRLKDTFELLGHHREITASIGVAVAPRDGVTSEELTQHCDQAMHRAKQMGGDLVQHFTAALKHEAQRRAQLQNEMRQALDLGQFEVHYQPILGLRDRSLLRCEALLRWRHPEFGAVSPAEFIPLAERSGLICTIGNWVFQTAVHQICEWQRRFGVWVQVAINLSPVQLQEPDDYLKQWVRLARRSGIPDGSILCEITEGVIVDPSEDTKRRLRILRDAGVELAVDDFGTGYCNFNLLSRLDVNKLKIDQSLIRGMGAAPRIQTICRTIVRMAHDLGWSVVAEGVETEEQQAMTSEIGCDYVQGYLVCRPGPAAAIEQMFQSVTEPQFQTVA